MHELIWAELIFFLGGGFTSLFWVIQHEFPDGGEPKGPLFASSMKRLSWEYGFPSFVTRCGDSFLEKQPTRSRTEPPLNVNHTLIKAPKSPSGAPKRMQHLLLKESDMSNSKIAKCHVPTHHHPPTCWLWRKFGETTQQRCFWGSRDGNWGESPTKHGKCKWSLKTTTTSLIFWSHILSGFARKKSCFDVCL